MQAIRSRCPALAGRQPRLAVAVAAGAAHDARRGGRTGAAARPQQQPPRAVAERDALHVPPLASPPASAPTSHAPKLPADIKSVLFTEEQIRAKVVELAQRIAADYEGKQLAIIGVLNGAFIVTSDLAREVSKDMPHIKVDFLRASSYGAASESTGNVKVKGASELSKWRDYHILLVEDIVDSGHTLARLSGLLSQAGAQSVRVAALLDKKGRRRVECWPDYVGWECPNDFIVGYGLDFNECYRCLPYIASLKEEVYAGSSH